MRVRQRPRWPSPSQIAVRAHVVRARRPPILPSHGPAPPPGDGSRLFVALAVDWFKRDGENGKAGDAPKLTKWSHAGMGSGAAESLKFTAPFFTARLRPRLSNYRRPPTP